MPPLEAAPLLGVGSRRFKWQGGSSDRRSLFCSRQVEFGEIDINNDEVF
jgi:hypothetical protein